MVAFWSKWNRCSSSYAASRVWLSISIFQIGPDLPRLVLQTTPENLKRDGDFCVYLLAKEETFQIVGIIQTKLVISSVKI